MLRQPISLCLSNSESQSARAGGRFVHEANGYTWLVTYLDIKARFTGKVFNLPNTFKEIIEVVALTIAVRTHTHNHVVQPTKIPTVAQIREYLVVLGVERRLMSSVWGRYELFLQLIIELSALEEWPFSDEIVSYTQM